MSVVLKKNIKVILRNCLLLLLVVNTMACDPNENGHDDQVNAPIGIWYSEAKGYVMEVTENKCAIFSTSAAGCNVFVEDFDPKEYFGLQLREQGNDQLIGTSEILLSDINFVKIEDQKNQCKPDQVTATKDAKVNFDHFWNIFNDYYAFFETRDVDWNKIKGLGDQVTNDNFYEIIEGVLYELGDGHVSIQDEELEIEIDSGSPGLLERLNMHLDSGLQNTDEDELYVMLNQKVKTILEKYLNNEFEGSPNDNMIWGLINDEIGYINILGMEGYAENPTEELNNVNKLLDQVLQDAQDAGIKKLIMDIRFNGGGFDVIAMEIAARFFDEERAVFSKKARLGDGFASEQFVSLAPKGNFQFTGDIILLTSPLTASAAEVFTMCMKELPYVTIVGENTNGIFSDVLTHRLPNGAEINLSNEVYSDSKGNIFEAIGIGPVEENKVPFLATDDIQNNEDGGVKKAIELLMD